MSVIHYLKQSNFVNIALESGLLSFLTLSIVQYVIKHWNPTFQFSGVGLEATTLLGPLEMARLNHWTNKLNELYVYKHLKSVLS